MKSILVLLLTFVCLIPCIYCGKQHSLASRFERYLSAPENGTVLYDHNSEPVSVSGFKFAVDLSLESNDSQLRLEINRLQNDTQSKLLQENFPLKKVFNGKADFRRCLQIEEKKKSLCECDLVCFKIHDMDRRNGMVDFEFDMQFINCESEGNATQCEYEASKLTQCSTSSSFSIRAEN